MVERTKEGRFPPSTKPKVVKLRPVPKPWERQTGEGAIAFRSFTQYRDMRSRSIAKLAALTGRTARGLHKMSSNHQWVLRCQAWEEELDKVLTEKQSDAISDMRNRHIQIGIGMQSAAAKELRAWVKKIEKADADARKAAESRGEEPSKAYHEPMLTVSDIVRLSDHGVNLERTSRGEAEGPAAGIESDGDLSVLSTAELKALKALKRKIGM